MARQSQNGGPPCPRPERLRELLDDEILLSLDGNEKIIDEVRQSLDWLATFLENRNLYHKRQARKNKILISLAREHGLEDEATKLSNDSIFNEVASSSPDDEL